MRQYLFTIFFLLYAFFSIADELTDAEYEFYFNLSQNYQLKKEHIKNTCGGDGEFSLEIKDCFMEENEKVRQAVMLNSKKTFEKTNKITESIQNKKSITDIMKEREIENKKKAEQYLKELLEKEKISKQKKEEELNKKKLAEQKYKDELLKKENEKKEQRKIFMSKSPDEKLIFQGFSRENVILSLNCKLSGKTFFSKKYVDIIHQIDFVSNGKKVLIFLDGIRGMPHTRQIAYSRMGGSMDVKVDPLDNTHPYNLFKGQLSIINLELPAEDFLNYPQKMIAVDPISLIFNVSIDDALKNKKGIFYLRSYFTNTEYEFMPNKVDGLTYMYTDYIQDKCILNN